MPDLLATKAAIKKVLGIVGDAVGLTDTQTMTNKTLTSPELNGVITNTGGLNINTDALINFRRTTTGHFIMEVGTVDGIAAIDFHVNELSDYDSRMVRLPGGDGIFQISNIGTGVIRFKYDDTGNYVIVPTDVSNKTLATRDGAETFTNKIYSGFKQLDAAKTGDYTLTTADSIIRADATASSFTLTLPAVSGNTGLTYSIIRTDIVASTNALTVDANSTELIDGNLTYILWPGESITIECDGTGWNLINQPMYAEWGYAFRKGSTANRRYLAGIGPVNSSLLTSSTGPTVNTLYGMPFVVSTTTKFDTIECEVTTGGASSNIRLGLYRDTGNVYPGALIFDSGNLDSSTTGAKSATITAALQTLQPGLYWLTYENSATVPQIRALPGVNTCIGIIGYPTPFGTNGQGYVYTVTHTVGALPNPFSAGATIRAAASAVGSPVPAVGLRAV